MLKDERDSQKQTLLSKWDSNRRKNIQNILQTAKNDTVGLHPSMALERNTCNKLRAQGDDDIPESIFRMDHQMQRGARIAGKGSNYMESNYKGQIKILEI